MSMRLDSLGLMNAFGAIGAIANPTTGIGTSRSKTENAGVNLDGRTLSQRELEAIAIQDKLIRKAIELLPKAAVSTWFKYSFTHEKDGDLGDEISRYLESLGDRADKTFTEENASDLYGAREAFEIAAILGRQFGKAYILMGVDDGLAFSEPINMDSIRSVRWLKVLDTYEIFPDYHLDRARSPSYYIDYYGVRIHKSRLLSFYGDRNYKKDSLIFNSQGGDATSIIQGMFDAYVSWVQGVKAGSAMLADYDVFTLGMRGLGELFFTDKQNGTTEGSEAVMRRALSLDTGKSVVRGIIYDLENEEPGSVTRSYAGARDIVQTLERRWAAVAGIPAFKLFGEIGSQGLTNNQGLAMRSEWALVVQEYADGWRSRLKYLTDICFSAKDSPTKGVIPEYEIITPYGLRLTKKEELEMEKIAAERAKILVDMGAIAPEEVRKSYESAEFDPTIILDKTPPKPPSSKTKREDAKSEILSDKEWEELAEISAQEYVAIAEGIANADDQA